MIFSGSELTSRMILTPILESDDESGAFHVAGACIEQFHLAESSPRRGRAAYGCILHHVPEIRSNSSSASSCKQSGCTCSGASCMASANASSVSPFIDINRRVFSAGTKASIAAHYSCVIPWSSRAHRERLPLVVPPQITRVSRCDASTGQFVRNRSPGGSLPYTCRSSTSPIKSSLCR